MLIFDCSYKEECVQAHACRFIFLRQQRLLVCLECFPVAMGLTSKVADVCGGVHNKRVRFISDNSCSGEITKNFRRDGKDSGQASFLYAADSDGVQIPRRDIGDTDDHSGVSVDVPRHAGAGYRGSAATSSVRIARDVVRTSYLPIGGVTGRMWMSWIRQDRANVSILFGLGCSRLSGKTNGSLWTAKVKCRCMVLGKCAWRSGVAQPSIDLTFG